MTYAISGKEHERYQINFAQDDWVERRKRDLSNDSDMTTEEQTTSTTTTTTTTIKPTPLQIPGNTTIKNVRITLIVQYTS